CGQADETIRHVLAYCPRWQEQRQSLIRLKPNMEVVRAGIRFLQSTARFMSARQAEEATSIATQVAT
ncbi:hypothetical protein BJ546DRAFT_963652, partial [Cryomyces antarcticus]